jgi:hypothetical protein
MNAVPAPLAQVRYGECGGAMVNRWSARSAVLTPERVPVQERVSALSSG